MSIIPVWNGNIFEEKKKSSSDIFNKLPTKVEFYFQKNDRNKYDLYIKYIDTRTTHKIEDISKPRLPKTLDTLNPDEEVFGYYTLNRESLNLIKFNEINKPEDSIIELIKSIIIKNKIQSTMLLFSLPLAQPPPAQSPLAQPPLAQSPPAQSPSAQSPLAQPPLAQSPPAQSPSAQSSYLNYKGLQSTRLGGKKSYKKRKHKSKRKRHIKKRKSKKKKIKKIKKEEINIPI